MKLTDKIANHDTRHPFYTFEFFPPRTDQGFENLLSRISRLQRYNPLAVSVTWGAGGSTKDRSIDLAGITQAEYGIDTVLHLTCTNMVPGLVDDILKAAKERGIQNVLALRGDPPRGAEQWMPTDPRFKRAIDLVSHIRATPEFASHFCVGVAAYPEGHPDHDSADGDPSEREIDVLKEKVDAGADFVVTQLFYDTSKFLTWITRVRERGIAVPIIPGIMPIQTYDSFGRVVKLCGVKIPPAIRADLEPIRHNDKLVKDYGVQLTIDTIRRITSPDATPNGPAVSGVHFCTLNLEKGVQLVLERLQWADASPRVKNRLIAETTGPVIHAEEPSSGLVVTPTTATDSATTALSHKVPENDPHREGDSAATWDDFPNGRFGDVKSPAFGAGDQWGGLGLSLQTPPQEWGNPKEIQDLTNMFLSYLKGSASTTPFSRSPLSPESETILPHLEVLTRRGWWTVCSQPAVDGARSEDEVFGWGPRGGYVYQKGFVEFFVPEEEVEPIKQAIEAQGKGLIHFFASNNEECFLTNVPEDGRNAVTWGMFPGQEIAQTTIIERESFLAWKEEAFSTWIDWASFYPPGSPERNCLESIRKRWWLLSIVHHDYRRPDALWSFLEGVAKASAGASV